MRHGIAAFCALMVCIFALAARAATVELTPTDDAFLQRYWRWPALNYSYYNYPTSTTIDLLASSGSTYEDTRVGLLKFDLSGIPADAIVSSVALRLHASNALYYDTTVTVSRMVEDSWGESTISWGTQPATGTGVAGLTDWTTNSVTLWMEAPLSLVSWNPADDLADGALTLQLYRSGGTMASLSARESGLATAPVLAISYTEFPEPGSVLLLLGALSMVARRRR